MKIQKKSRFSDSIKEANVEIASYVIYNDEEDFINGLFLRKAISKYELQSGNDGEGTVDTDQTPTDPGQPGGSGAGTGDGTGDAGDDSTPGESDGDNQEQNNDKFIDVDEGYKRGYTTSDKLHVVIPTKGQMKANAGETPQKRVSVIVPTNASFTVKNDGTFIGTSLKVTNNGEVPVDISVANFIDPNGDYGIQLVTDQDVNSNISRTNYKRNQINLWLENEGESKKIYLGDKKLYLAIGSTKNITKEEDKKIATVLNENTSTINISGKAGENALDRDEPIRDNFKLILKIKRSSIN